MSITTEYFVDHAGMPALAIDSQGNPVPQAIEGNLALGKIALALFQHMELISPEDREVIVDWVKKSSAQLSHPDDPHADLVDVPSAEEEAEWQAKAKRFYRITHHYSIGDQDVFVEHPTGEVDGVHIASYIFMKACDWFGSGYLISNLGVAAAMVAFYGFRHCARPILWTDADLYWDVERRSAQALAMMKDITLERKGLREALGPHLHGRPIMSYAVGNSDDVVSGQFLPAEVSLGRVQNLETTGEDFFRAVFELGSRSDATIQGVWHDAEEGMILFMARGSHGVETVYTAHINEAFAHSLKGIGQIQIVFNRDGACVRQFAVALRAVQPQQALYALTGE